MGKEYKDVVKNFFEDSERTFVLTHKDLRKMKPMLNSLRVDFEKHLGEVKSFIVQIPMLVEYDNVVSEIVFKDGRIIDIEKEGHYFLIDPRVEESLLTRKDYKTGLSFILKWMSSKEKNVISDILKDYIDRDAISDNDWKKVDDEIFECFLLSSNELNDFIKMLPNLHKLSLELEKSKSKFNIQEDSLIPMDNFQSVIQEFVYGFSNVKLL